MTFWAVSSLINLFTSFSLGIFVFSRSKKALANITYGIFCLSVSAWSIAYFFWQISDNYIHAFLWSKVLMAAGVFIPICYLHYIYAMLRLSKDRKVEIYFAYAFGVVSMCLCFTGYFIKGVSQKLYFEYWPDAGDLFGYFLAIWFFIVLRTVYLLLRYLRISDGLHRTQIKYLLIATIIGWSGGITNFPLWFNIPVPPVGNILVSVHLCIIAYAIIRLRLMDIKLVISRATIFILVYTLVLGIPFYVGFKLFGVGLWLIPVLTMAVLATAGPYLYIFLQRRAEARILSEQKQYQKTLKSASLGMAKIKELKHLLDFIIHTLYRSIKIEHCSIYLFDEVEESYALRATTADKKIKSIKSDSELINYFINNQNPIIIEELKGKYEQQGKIINNDFLDSFISIDAELIVPIFSDKRVLALITMGKKKSRQIYSEDDLTVFDILAKQAATSIENAVFYEESKKDLAQQFHESRLRSLGALGSGIAHQMYNRLNVISLGGDSLLELLDNIKEGKVSEEIIKEIRENVERMTKSAMRGTEITEAIKNYAKTDIAPQSISLDEVVKSSMSLVAVKHPRLQYNLITEYNTSNQIWANYSTLQDIVYNALDNSCDAMEIKKENQNNQGYQPEIIIMSEIMGDIIKIEIKDNGIGMTKDELDKVLVPFYTTKGSKKGTGMGINMVYHLLLANKGTLNVDSKSGEWTIVTITLPRAI
ncbi:MAG: ATP-binding protein [Candidatus Zapsychrus exili]|nr:ATP-binding protein [Candidatus Zapsychrus exili]